MEHSGRDSCAAGVVVVVVVVDRVVVDCNVDNTAVKDDAVDDNVVVELINSGVTVVMLAHGS